MQNLLNNVKFVRVQNAAAAGTTPLKGETVDMDGYDGVTFVYGVGALTATQQTKLKAGGGSESNGSDATDLEGTGTPQGGYLDDADGNKLIVLDIPKPQYRYITPTLVRGTANAVVDFGIAILYKGRHSPAVQDSTVAASQTVVSPFTGTAG